MLDTNFNIEKDLPYNKIAYDNKGRFTSYWHQINEVIKLKPRRVLEIGKGNGFVCDYLKKNRIDLSTLDIEYNLAPDIVGSTLEIPLANETFDVGLCCQVLEHLPFHYFPKALKELYRVTKINIVLSFPDITPVYRVNIELPRIKPIKVLLSHPFNRPAKHLYDGQHYWEIGKKGYSFRRINCILNRSGFRILKTYRVFEYYYHRFYILEKL